MKKVYSSSLLLLIFTFLNLLNAQGNSDFKIIVNNENNIEEISKSKLANIFMKNVTQWSDGSKIFPVDLNSKSNTRSNFSQVVHGKSVEAIQAFWRKQIFSGSKVPPLEKDNDSEVIKYVKENPGSIGYVSNKADTRGTKVIKILE
jgi:ABC-type phosphate transport system substrate-binding protein